MYPFASASLRLIPSGSMSSGPRAVSVCVSTEQQQLWVVLLLLVSTASGGMYVSVYVSMFLSAHADRRTVVLLFSAEPTEQRRYTDYVIA